MSNTLGVVQRFQADEPAQKKPSTKRPTAAQRAAVAEEAAKAAMARADAAERTAQLALEGARLAEQAAQLALERAARAESLALGLTDSSSAEPAGRAAPAAHVPLARPAPPLHPRTKPFVIGRPPEPPHPMHEPRSAVARSVAAALTGGLLIAMALAIGMCT